MRIASRSMPPPPSPFLVPSVTGMSVPPSAPPLLPASQLPQCAEGRPCPLECTTKEWQPRSSSQVTTDPPWPSGLMAAQSIAGARARLSSCCVSAPSSRLRLPPPCRPAVPNGGSHKRCQARGAAASSATCRCVRVLIERVLQPVTPVGLPRSHADGIDCTSAPCPLSPGAEDNKKELGPFEYSRGAALVQSMHPAAQCPPAQPKPPGGGGAQPTRAGP